MSSQGGASLAKAIIVAAGRGRRLGASTDGLPKCMVEVGGKPMLHWQLEALSQVGVRDVVIVRGYLGDKIHPGRFPVRFIDDPAWAENDVLASLMCASSSWQRLLFSYCDIVYAHPRWRGSAAVAGTAHGSLGRRSSLGRHLRGAKPCIRWPRPSW